MFVRLSLKLITLGSEKKIVLWMKIILDFPIKIRSHKTATVPMVAFDPTSTSKLIRTYCSYIVCILCCTNYIMYETKII